MSKKKKSDLVEPSQETDTGMRYRVIGLRRSARELETVLNSMAERGFRLCSVTPNSIILEGDVSLVPEAEEGTGESPTIDQAPTDSASEKKG